MTSLMVGILLILKNGSSFYGKLFLFLCAQAINPGYNLYKVLHFTAKSTRCKNLFQTQQCMQVFPHDCNQSSGVWRAPTLLRKYKAHTKNNNLFILTFYASRFFFSLFFCTSKMCVKLMRVDELENVECSPKKEELYFQQFNTQFDGW